MIASNLPAIINLLTMIVALAGAVFSYSNHQKIKSTEIKVDENKLEVNQLHLSVNSRMDELLKITKEASFAAGALSEKTKT